MPVKNIWFTIILLMFGIAGKSQSAWYNHYKIYDTKNHKTVTISDLVKSVKDVDVLFFGEEHNDSIGHRVQDTLYRSMLQEYTTVTLSMEMFERDCQQVLNEYLLGFITDEMLVKEGRGWSNYKDYRPMVNAAKLSNQYVIAANAPRRYVSMVSKKGLGSLDALPKSSKANFAKLPLDTVNIPYLKKFSDLMGGMHAGSNNIYYAQTMWDATMAESIYKYWKKHKRNKILHLNGRFHTDSRLGTYTQLARKNKRINIQNISCFAAEDFKNPDWSQYESLGDYIIITDAEVAKSY